MKQKFSQILEYIKKQDYTRYKEYLKHLNIKNKKYLPAAMCLFVFLMFFLITSFGENQDAVSINYAGEAAVQSETVSETAQEIETTAVATQPETKPLGNQWIQNEEGWKYISNGEYLKDKWLVVDGCTYYLREDGTCAYGPSDVNGTWYYFARSGELVEDTLVEGTYLTDPDGKLLTGYQWIENQQYFFQDDGQMLKSGKTPDGVYNTNQDGVITSINMAQTKSSCPLENAPGTSGYKIGGYPLELYMLSIAGETSGGSIIIGDEGRAYGLCQFDYRYDLMAFINYAYGVHPNLWIGFKDIAGKYGTGDAGLINNDAITNGFALADQLSAANCASDQLQFLYNRYFSNTCKRMQSAGYNLAGRHIAVSAAIMSININCGVQTDLYLSKLSAEMTDEEMINTLYELRNGVLTANGKGTNKRFGVSEPRLALDMLSGQVTVTSNLYYGSGVSWNKSLLRYCGKQIPESQIAARLASLGNGITIKLPDLTLEESTTAEESTAVASDSNAQSETKEIGPGIPR